MFEENWQLYGVRKVWRQLGREGIAVARCTVARLMKDMGLQGIIRGKPHRTTVPDKKAPCPLDKVNRQFRVPAPNMLWVSYFTYVATWKGFACVAFVIDACARRIVGWRGSRSAHAGFVLDALEQAVHERRPAKGMGLVHHSDRGSQYLSIKYSERLGEAGIEPSVAAIVTRTDGVPRRPSETAMTTLSRRPSTACSRRRSSTAAVLGAVSRPSNTRRSNGSTGSIPAAFSSPSGTSHPQKPKKNTTRLWKLMPWPRN